MTNSLKALIASINDTIGDAARLYGDKWDSSLVSGEKGSPAYHAITSEKTNDVVVRAKDGSRESSWLCDYLEAVSPANVKALIAALEQAQSQLGISNEKLDKIKSNSCHVDTGKDAFIPNSLDAWGRPVPQYLPYDFSGNPGASATQYCNGWNDSGSYWLNHVMDLQGQLNAAKAELEAAAVKPVSVETIRELWPVPVRHDYPSGRDYAGAMGMYRQCTEVLRAAGIQVEGE